ncbi:helix-turn-helix domain-containing protein [Mariniflexile sp.]|uniref:helix-turn-helix domain-containing protein n=1 Tax=Mariniflexile sp. TaxID=1979402 RepID=UPI0040479CEA
MPTSIITTDDLRDFKIELLNDIKKLLIKQSGTGLKKYLKSSEVMDLLSISAGTLQNLRMNGTIPYTKMGGINFYEADEIQKVMIANRIQIKLSEDV